jgi:hypothetical protein
MKTFNKTMEIASELKIFFLITPEWWIVPSPNNLGARLL